MLPYFIRSEGNQRGKSATHGGDGPLACSDIGAKHQLIEAIIAGAGELGVPHTDDFNGGAVLEGKSTTIQEIVASGDEFVEVADEAPA